jgi:hypothetical protein
MSDIDMSEVVKLAGDLGEAAVRVPVQARAAVAKAGREMWESMRADVAVRTGELRDGIYLREGLDSVEAGTDVEHGFYNEFGTVDMAPQPWAFHNADRAEESVVESLGDIDIL